MWLTVAVRSFALSTSSSSAVTVTSCSAFQFWAVNRSLSSGLAVLTATLAAAEGVMVTWPEGLLSSFTVYFAELPVPDSAMVRLVGETVTPMVAATATVPVSRSEEPVCPLAPALTPRLKLTPKSPLWESVSAAL